MKPTDTTAATPPPPPPPPAFDPAAAQAVHPRRHASTARTVGYVQGAHLFSATRDFIATATPAEAEAFLAPPPAPPAPEATAAS